MKNDSIQRLAALYRANPLEVMAYNPQDHFEKDGQPKDIETDVRRQLDDLIPALERAFRGQP